MDCLEKNTSRICKAHFKNEKYILFGVDIVIKQLGNSGVKVSDHLGCWVMGGTYWGGADDKDSLKQL